MIALKMLLALVLDALLGEPRRGHPLIGFGWWVTRTEALLRNSAHTAARQCLSGLLAWSLLVVLPGLLLWGLLQALSGWTVVAAEVFVLYLTLGNRSLAEHLTAIATPLRAGNLAVARDRVAMIVSRDTAELDESGVTRAALESLLENGSDAVLAPLFWFIVAGAPGALCYRLANTLDARWGYRSVEYLHFGRAAARLDDLLNWVPARLCALSYGLVGHLPAALHCWRTQAPQAASPNAGPVMAAGAGALGIRLGGAARYRGVEEWRPLLGRGRDPEVGDIRRALRLLWRAVALWVLVTAALELG